MIDKKYAQQEKIWRAESALRTITQAEEHKRDPGLMRDVKRIATQQIRSLSKVASRPGKKK